jgi:hypothetical protein
MALLIRGDIPLQWFALYSWEPIASRLPHPLHSYAKVVADFLFVATQYVIFNASCPERGPPN